MKRFIPQPLLLAYHAIIAWVSQLLYGFPTRRMVTIGVTGTDGKTSTVNYISQVLEAAGHPTGFTSTANFKIGSVFSLNPMKMTMPGRWTLARLLHQIKKSGAEYAVVENTSEGLRQFRHLGIDYDIAVFTNLSPEHIESHGSFENYRKAKEKLFATLSKSKRKPGAKKIIVANLDDANAKYFLAYDADEKWGFSLETDQSNLVGHVVRPTAFACRPDGISFTLSAQGITSVQGSAGGAASGEPITINTKLVGIFNLKNMLAATAVALSRGIKLAAIKNALEAIQPVPGRMEPIVEGQPFTVIVDYAHAPKSLELVYQTLREQLASDKKLIAVLGAAGGGRDKGKRPVMGGLAAKHADFAVVTNEDPYDEDPQSIIDQVTEGLRSGGKQEGIDFFRVAERRAGMKRAFEAARPGDIVVITGKGCESVIMSKGGERVAHDDRAVARSILHELGFTGRVS